MKKLFSPVQSLMYSMLNIVAVADIVEMVGIVATVDDGFIGNDGYSCSGGWWI